MWIRVFLATDGAVLQACITQGESRYADATPEAQPFTIPAAIHEAQIAEGLGAPVQARDYWLTPDACAALTRRLAADLSVRLPGEQTSRVVRQSPSAVTERPAARLTSMIQSNEIWMAFVRDQAARRGVAATTVIDEIAAKAV